MGVSRIFLFPTNLNSNIECRDEVSFTLRSGGIREIFSVRATPSESVLIYQKRDKDNCEAQERQMILAIDKHLFSIHLVCDDLDLKFPGEGLELPFYSVQLQRSLKDSYMFIQQYTRNTMLIRIYYEYSSFRAQYPPKDRECTPLYAKPPHPSNS